MTSADRSRHRTIGLTGGIAMGKTLVSNYLADHYHLPILDADIYAREAVAIGSPVLQQIVDRYDQILQPDGSLDRAKLGEIIFNSPRERQWLEQQIHPFVRDRLQTEYHRYQMADPPQPVVFVIPLLFEAEMTDLVDEIWVIYCPKAQQLNRLLQRDQLSQAQAEARIASQMPIEQKCAQADVVLNNASTIEALLNQVDRAIAGKL